MSDRKKGIGSVVFLIIVMFVALGCVPQVPTGTAEYEKPEVRDMEDTSRVLSAGYDEVWEALVNHSASTFFQIDNLEKGAGLIVLSFGAGEPERFIDCGYWEYRRAAFASLEEIDYEGSYVRYMERSSDAELNGKMNLTIQEVDEESSRITVNARYLFEADANTWSFETNSYADIEVVNASEGTPPTRRCVPTYEAEREILDGVQERLK